MIQYFCLFKSYTISEKKQKQILIAASEPAPEINNPRAAIGIFTLVAKMIPPKVAQLQASRIDGLLPKLSEKNENPMQPKNAPKYTALLANSISSSS